MDVKKYSTSQKMLVLDLVGIGLVGIGLVGFGLVGFGLFWWLN